MVGFVVTLVVWDFLDSRRSAAKGLVGNFEAIPSGLVSQASRWHWSQSSAERPKVEIFADSFRQSTETHLFDLEGVELRIFHKNGRRYDQVISRAARFDSRTEKLHGDGEVTLILGIDLESAGNGAEAATKIRSSGVTFEAKTGVCVTDRPTVYEFAGGSGRSVGAFYDSVRRYFRMDKQVHVFRDPPAPGLPPVEVRAQELHYHEVEQRVDLVGGVQLKQGPREARAEKAHVYLEQGEVRRVDLTRAGGREQQAGRAVEFEAELAMLWYGPGQVLEKVVGERSARVRSVSGKSALTAWGERLQLLYDPLPGGKGSVLRAADARVSAGVEAAQGRPARSQSAGGVNDAAGAAGGAGERPVRRVSSEWILLTMKPGGQEIDRVETHAPGSLELIPGSADPWRRRMTAKRIRMDYGPANRMEKLLAFGDVEVLNTPPPSGKTEARTTTPLSTWSQYLEADFDEAGEAARIKQWNGFRFRRGTSEGSAEQADLDLPTGRTRLRKGARIRNESGAVNADMIVLEEAAGRMEARGKVSSVHSESAAAGEGASESLFSPAEPVLATAENLLSEQEHGVLRYSGQARLWQGVNRVEAQNITIDRRGKNLSARGDVRTVMRPSGGGPNGGKSAFPEALVRVSSHALDYDETTGRAVYRKQAKLTRQDLTVFSDEIEGLLDGEDGGAELQAAFARGAVRIFRSSAGPSSERQGFGREAEYLPAEDRVELTGSPARLRTANGRETWGARLIYHLAEDRIIVDGGGRQRAYSFRPAERPTP